MTYKLNHRFYKNQKSHCFTINEFHVLKDFAFKNLFDSDVFDNEIQPDHVKDSQDDMNGYLKGLFYSNKLSIDDFKFLNSNSIYFYMEGFSDSEQEWGDDKLLFKKLLEEFKEISKGNLDGSYLINKEWFSKESDKVRNREFTLYDYYFIIIWMDKNDESKLYISEWFSD